MRHPLKRARISLRRPRHARQVRLVGEPQGNQGELRMPLANVAVIERGDSGVGKLIAKSHALCASQFGRTA